MPDITVKQIAVKNQQTGEYEYADIGSSASLVDYDNTSSALVASNTQEAIDEVNTKINNKSTVAITQVESSGTKVATVNIDGTNTDVYAPTPINVVANPSASGIITNLTQLTVDNTTYNIPQGTSSVSELSDLSNVAISNVENGQILKYNATSQEWVNANESGGGSGDTVTWTQITQSGSKIAEIDINGVTTNVYAPANEMDLVPRLTANDSASEIGIASDYAPLSSRWLAWHGFATESTFNPSINGQYWATNTTGGYVQFAFEEEVTITKVAFGSYNASSFTINYSLDGINYSTADTITRSAGSTTATQTILNNPITCKYFRFVADTIPSGSFDIGAIHLYGNYETSNNLEDLSDVNITSPTEGQVLKYDSTNDVWINGEGGSSVGDLDDLGDVTLTSPTDGQILKYDATNQEWINANDSGGAEYLELTQAQYNALTPAQKNNGTIYFITDAESGGGSGSSSEIIELEEGDGTSSRTFVLPRTPKFVSMSWTEGDTASSWNSYYSFNWGDRRAYGMNGQVDIGSGNILSSSITYGNDNKSFTLTRTNAGTAMNTTGTNHHGYMFVDYGTSGGSSSGGGIDYSTTEQDTGIKWIDGKTIYQITEILSSPATIYNSTYTGFQPSWISSVDNFIKCTLYRTNNSQYGATCTEGWARKNGNELNLYCGLEFRECEIITFQYTKTSS